MNDRNSPVRWRWPTPLVTTFYILVLVNLLMIHVAFDMDSSSAGGDAAGNAMSNAFNQLIKYAALCVVAIPSILSLLIRKWGFRVAMNVLLGISVMILLVLASFIHGTQ